MPRIETGKTGSNAAPLSSWEAFSMESELYNDDTWFAKISSDRRDARRFCWGAVRRHRHGIERR
jgi:hypothetical protein